MRLHTRLIVMVAVLSLVAAACHSGSSGSSSPTTGAPGTVVKGGTLQLGLEADVSNAYDPQKEYAALSFEFFRSCLLRTLLSYNALDASQGGDSVRPDLATALPEVSADGLTYTFHIKSGLDYGPPFQTEEITAQGFMNALEREADPAASAEGYAFYYSPIQGFDALSAKEGKDETLGGTLPIPGVSSPDPHTLVIKLTAPTGDFGYRMTLPATAPIPDLPNGKPASTGHQKDYGRFLVPSGPYMFAGTPALDFSVPASQQKPVSGYVPGRSMTLIRNPSWKDDSLRPAYVDGIDVQIGATATDLAEKVDSGEIDFDMSGVPPQSQLQAYESDPTKKSQIHAFPSDATRYLTMNMAVPPFDDVHLRRAVEWVIDKDALRRARGGPLFGDIAGHFIPPSLLAGVADAQTYNPYATPGNQGDLAKAKAEMAQSKYDTNHDGICDASACSGILSFADNADPYPAQDPIISADMAKIGLKLDIKSGDRYTFMYDKCLTPGTHAAFCPSIAWGKDYPDAVTFGPPTLGSASIGSFDIPMAGASAATLKQYGYTSAFGVTSVPSFDAEFAKCEAMPIGQARTDCWFDADKQIMAQAPVVPYLWDSDVQIVGPRVTNYTFDQFAGLVSLDHIALVNGGA